MLRTRVLGHAARSAARAAASTSTCLPRVAGQAVAGPLRRSYLKTLFGPVLTGRCGQLPLDVCCRGRNRPVKKTCCKHAFYQGHGADVISTCPCVHPCLSPRLDSGPRVGFAAPRLLVSSPVVRTFSTGNLDLVLRQADSVLVTVKKSQDLVMAGRHHTSYRNCTCFLLVAAVTLLTRDAHPALVSSLPLFARHTIHCAPLRLADVTSTCVELIFCRGPDSSVDGAAMQPTGQIWTPKSSMRWWQELAADATWSTRCRLRRPHLRRPRKVCSQRWRLLKRDLRLPSSAMSWVCARMPPVLN